MIWLIIHRHCCFLLFVNIIVAITRVLLLMSWVRTNTHPHSSSQVSDLFHVYKKKVFADISIRPVIENEGRKKVRIRTQSSDTVNAWNRK
jgi:hypothetical protein